MLSSSNKPEPDAISPSVQYRREGVLHRFEAAWRSGQRPLLTDFLAQVPQPDQASLLRELLQLDSDYRRQAGETPQVSDYLAVLPEHRTVIVEILSSFSEGMRPPMLLSAEDTATGAVPSRSISQDSTLIPQRSVFLETSTSHIGDYEILGEIARGGMGVVYRARHTKLGRIAAVKLIKSGQLADEAEVQRFQIEAQAAAGLDHSGIVSVYEVGQQDGQHYMALAYVDGQSLWQRVKESPLPPQEAARLMQQVADAMQYAHDHGIIHRDLKPHNILLTKDGQPKVTDFGLAKKQTGDSSLTGTGQVLGTPSYMPPEQVSGKTNAIGPLADVYSLGATLYCLLTGRPPFQAATALDTLMQVLHQEPVAPRQLNPAIPKDLETICLKCLQKDPVRRYGSAAELSEDLRRTLSGEMISAIQPGFVDHLRFALRQNRDDVELAAWAKILSWFLWIVPASEAIVWLFRTVNVPNLHACSLAARAVEFATMAAILWRYRASWWPPRTSSARHMLSQWIAFMLGCHLAVYVVVVVHLRSGSDEPMDLFSAYPMFTILSGVLWFTLGSNFWGYCYAFGAAFFALALVMPLTPDIAPLEFGLLWTICLWATVRRLEGLVQLDLQTLPRHAGPSNQSRP